MKIKYGGLLFLASVSSLICSSPTESQRHFTFIKKNLLERSLTIFNINQHLVKPMIAGITNKDELYRLVSPHKERILSRGEEMIKRNNDTIHYRDLDLVLAEILLVELVAGKDCETANKARTLINKLVQEKILIVAEEFTTLLEQKKSLPKLAGINDLDGVVHKLNLARFAFSGIDEELGDRANILAKKIHSLVKKPY